MSNSAEGRQSDRAMSDYQRMRRIVLALLIVVIAVPLIFGESMHSDVEHEQIEAFGRMLILIGIGGRLWSTLYIGGRKSAEVVDTGPYSIMRNPLYFFSTIAIMGVGGQAGSYALAIGFAILCWLSFLVVIRREEEFLSDRMGEPYRRYLRRVPRFFPRPWLWRDEPTVTFQPHMLKRTLMDGLAFFVSVPIFELIENAQDSGFLPVLFHFW
jgi:protein-S-isoprenylcysteine O-methyltransferase Ste14